MYLCVHVCTSVSLYVGTYECVCVCVCVCAFALQARVYVARMCANTYVCMNLCLYVCLFVCVYVYMYELVCMYASTYVRIVYEHLIWRSLSVYLCKLWVKDLFRVSASDRL